LYISALPFNFGNLVLWNTFFFLFSEKASLLQKIAAWLSFFKKKEKVEERSQSGLHVRLQGAML
jgi:hypothetical protein